MELGTAAEWAGTVGTIGALLVGSTLFARERAISRRAGVDALITWLSWDEVADSDGGFRFETIVHVRRPALARSTLPAALSG